MGPHQTATIHDHSRYLLTIAAALGVFPVKNTQHHNIKRLKFTTKSIRFLFSLVLLAGFLVLAAYALQFTLSKLTLKDLTAYGFKSITGSSVYYWTTVVTYYNLLNLARDWPGVLVKWAQMEREMRDRRTSFKWSILAQFTLITLAMLEHGFHNYMAARYPMEGLEAQNVISSYFQKFTLVTHSFAVSSNDDYTLFKGICIAGLSFTSTFLWTFNNVFAITISRQLIKLIRAYGKILRNKNFSWESKRLMYHKLRNFVADISDRMKNIVGFATMCDFYFVCVQLFEMVRIDSSLKKKGAGELSLFYLVSFGFLVIRNMSTLYAAAAVNAEWKSLQDYVISKTHPNSYLERFTLEVTLGEIGLSWFKFCLITKSFIARIIGAMITYEILLIQLNS